MASTPPDFDAILLVSFGGPEGPDDVLPFLENVTRGRGIPKARLEKVAEQYLLFGGVSPINASCRRLIHALENELAKRGPDLPIYWGNRNWPPMLADTMQRMADDGIQRAVAIATSAFSSYSGCRQYLNDIDRARAHVGETAPLVEKIAPYWNHPGFLKTMMENTRAALNEQRSSLTAQSEGGQIRLVFTAHSIPLAMAATSAYQAQLEEAAGLIANDVAPELAWDLVYQSRSGPPSVPWLEPDVCDHLAELANQGTTRVVLIPLGFVADHMEVLYDLDTQAKAAAGDLGITLNRARTVEDAPRFVAALRDLVINQIEGSPRETLGTMPACPYPCLPTCCAYEPAGRPPTRAAEKPTTRPS